jgi:hypothetical protein
MSLERTSGGFSRWFYPKEAQRSKVALRRTRAEEPWPSLRLAPPQAWNRLSFNLARLVTYDA